MKWGSREGERIELAKGMGIMGWDRHGGTGMDWGLGIFPLPCHNSSLPCRITPTVLTAMPQTQPQARAASVTAPSSQQGRRARPSQCPRL